MPDFYSEAEAATYEVILGASFEAETHWLADEAPAQGPRGPSSPQAHKSARPPPRQQPDSRICQRDREQVRLAGTTWGRDPGDRAGLQVSGTGCFGSQHVDLVDLFPETADVEGWHLGGECGTSPGAAGRSPPEPPLASRKLPEERADGGSMEGSLRARGTHPSGWGRRGSKTRSSGVAEVLMASAPGSGQRLAVSAPGSGQLPAGPELMAPEGTALSPGVGEGCGERAFPDD